MKFFFQNLSVPTTLLMGISTMMITSASASGKSSRAWTVVETTKEGIGYTLTSFTKFVQPSARRIHSEGGPQGIQSIAFSNNP